MTQVTYRLTANNRDQLRNPTLGNRVYGLPLPFLLLSEGRGGRTGGKGKGGGEDSGGDLLLGRGEGREREQMGREG